MKKFYIIVFLFFLNACTNFNQPQEVWIENAQNEKIYAKIYGIENRKYHKLAILQHGLASDMNHHVINTAKQAFLDNDFVVITFDSRHSLGESGNDVEKVTLATFVEDMETIVNWAENQSLYRGKLALAGHSLGGASAMKFGAKYPNKVDVLIPITPVISGKLWEKSCMENMSDFCHQWKEDGSYQYVEKQSNKTVIIPYNVIESCKSYDAYELAPMISAKTLLITAEYDNVINPDDVKELAPKIKGGEITIIRDSGHNFSSNRNQIDLYRAIDEFLK